ncbi:MAG: PGN_0703 family putative restriction endonuclease [Bacteroidales bacterium]
MEIGKQYSRDDDFKRKARLHQSKYRAEILQVDFDEFGNMLKEEDGQKGLNFYSEFDILDAVYERYGKKYSKQLYSNLLRSEHIPFNFFIPLRYDLDFARIVLNEFVSNSIKEVFEIKIEYAPEPAENYLYDRTSFDAYIKYIHSDNEIGILGIEVKYTEQAYPLKKGSKEDIDINNKNSNYWSTTRKSGLFENPNEESLIRDDFRQIWRNHLLGESIKQKDHLSHFTSITLYPKGNSHFEMILPKYKSFLTKKESVIGITYEDFFEKLKVHSPSIQFNRWIDYLNKRYII